MTIYERPRSLASSRVPNTKLLLLTLTLAITPLLSPYTCSQKRQQEEKVDEVSALSKHDLCEFNDMTAACKDLYYQIRIPQLKQKRECKDKVL